MHVGEGDRAATAGAVDDRDRDAEALGHAVGEMRAVTSAALPAPKGTVISIGRLGNCARLRSAHDRRPTNAATTFTRLIISTSP